MSKLKRKNNIMRKTFFFIPQHAIQLCTTIFIYVVLHGKYSW